MNDVCLIDKRKVVLAYILIVVAIISTFMAGFNNIFVIFIVISIVSYWFVVIKYIRCSNCDSVIYLSDLSYIDYKYCKTCGLKIVYK